MQLRDKSLTLALRNEAILALSQATRHIVNYDKRV